MAAPGPRKIWIRGAGLNSRGHPDRAEGFLGVDWENEAVEVTVLKMRPGGALHVMLEDGYKLWVDPQHVTEGPMEVDVPEEVLADDVIVTAELGSDPKTKITSQKHRDKSKGRPPYVAEPGTSVTGSHASCCSVSDRWRDTYEYTRAR